MENKKIAYIATGLIVLLLIVVTFINLSGFIIKKKNSDINSAQEIELNKYRSDEMPEDCRLPDYEENVESWKQHLSHHKETLYCLDYYE